MNAKYRSEICVDVIKMCGNNDFQRQRSRLQPIFRTRKYTVRYTVVLRWVPRMLRCNGETDLEWGLETIIARSVSFWHV